jgi:hypothetical protein
LMHGAAAVSMQFLVRVYRRTMHQYRRPVEA